MNEIKKQFGLIASAAKNNFLAVGLCVLFLFLAVAAHAQQFSATVTYSESMRRDTKVTSALYKVNASIPMTIPLDEVDETTVLWVDHGVSLGINTGIGFALGRDSSYTPGKTTATISSAGVYMSIKWSATNIAFNGYILGKPNLEAASGETMPFSFEDDVYISFGSSDFYHSAQVSGRNYAKSVNSQFSGEVFVLNHGSFNIVADLIPPVVTVTSPKQNFVVTQDLVSVQVSSKDNFGLGRDPQGTEEYFAYSVNGGDHILVPLVSSEQTNSAGFDVSGLSYGTNTIRIFAYDTSRNEGHADLIVFYSYVSQISLTVDGPGTVSGITDGQSAVVGMNITAKATPMTGKVFLGWFIGESLIRSSTLSYPMSEGMSIVATFADNPFAASKGTFNGLFYPDSEEPPAGLQNSGFISLTETALGGFTAKLTLVSGTVSFSGQFYPNTDGTAGTDPYSIVLPTKQTARVQLNIVTDTNSETFGMVTGTVEAYGSQSWISSINAEMVYFDTNLVNGGAGVYNFAITGVATDSSEPNGYSFGSVAVSKTGTVTASLSMADSGANTNTFSGSVTRSGKIPFFVGLYKTNGAAFGYINLGDVYADAPSAVTSLGSLHWIKNPTGGVFYPDGFLATFDIVGAKYVAPTDSNLHLGNVSYGGAGLDDKSKEITYKKGIVTVTDSSGNEDKLAAKFDPATGKFSGTFVDPVYNKTRTFSGLMVGTSEGNFQGYGLFLGASESGYFSTQVSLE